MGPAVISPRTPLSPAGAQACGAALSAPHSCCCLRYGRKRLWEAAGARPQQHRGPSVIYPRPWLRASPLREEKLRPRRRLALQPSGTPGSGAGGPLPPHEVAPRGPPPALSAREGLGLRVCPALPADGFHRAEPRRQAPGCVPPASAADSPVRHRLAPAQPARLGAAGRTRRPVPAGPALALVGLQKGAQPGRLWLVREGTFSAVSCR